MLNASDARCLSAIVRQIKMSSQRIIVSRLLLAVGILFTALALLVFAMPFVAAVSGSYEGGGQAIGAFFFYLLLGIPAFILGSASVLFRGWREARAGYVVLGCLVGVPLLTLAVALLHAVYDSLR
jgi:hypothetical protein